MKTGTIYIIFCLDRPDICYIGSTFCKETHKRWKLHRESYNNGRRNISIYKYFDRYGIDRFLFKPLKKYEVVDRKHLHAYETLYISKTRCVNKCNAVGYLKYCGCRTSSGKRRRRRLCKRCDGSSICEHGRQKCLCKRCDGSSICEHGRQKYKCKQCYGTGICEHGRQKYQCKQCNGKGICEHGRRKYQCKQCDGSSICEHGRQKYKCKQCNG